LHRFGAPARVVFEVVVVLFRFLEQILDGRELLEQVCEILRKPVSVFGGSADADDRLGDAYTRIRELDDVRGRHGKLPD
jgi:hypothetical protein